MLPDTSAAAVEAAARVMRVAHHHYVLSDGYAKDVIAAAYAVDMPRIRAEARAEILAEVVAWLRSEGRRRRWAAAWAADAIAAKFGEQEGDDAA